MARRKSRRRARRATARSHRRRRRSSTVHLGRRTYRKSRKARVIRRSARTGRRYSRRVRTYRRNPGLLAGITRGIKRGAAVSGGVILYNAAQRYLGAMIPLPISGAAGDALKGGLLAVASSWAAEKFIKGELGGLVVAGVWSGFINGLLRGFNVPVVSGLLGEYDVPTNTIDGMGAYPRALPATVGSYPVGTAAAQMAYANG